MPVEDRDYEDELLSPRQAVAFLQELWGQPVTVTSFRMLRLRRKGDPDMPEPDYKDEESDTYLWKRRTLRRIKQPRPYKR